MRARNRRKGFTLIELMVVVSIIAVLISILLPSLGRAREQARSVVCQTHLRALAQAFRMFSVDHQGRLPGVGGGDINTHWDWLGPWRCCYGTDPTSPEFLNAPKGGRLWPYYRSEKLVLCPSDRSGNGKFSYSMPGILSRAAGASWHARRGPQSTAAGRSSGGWPWGAPAGPIFANDRSYGV